MRKKSFSMALGGITAALAVAVMSIGTLIPFATYVCPVICALTLQMVFRLCGSRIAWAWYCVVAILSLLLVPDKEAAAVFLFLGYYPIVKTKLDIIRSGWLWKLLWFNSATMAAYAFLIWIMGLAELMRSFREAGAVLNIVTFFLGNATFFLLDRLLSRRLLRK